MLNEVGFSRDHSGSMYGFKTKAAKDFNAQIHSVREGAHAGGIDALVSVVECGGGIRTVYAHQPVHMIPKMSSAQYRASGGTPLFDSIGKLIEMFQNTPRADDPDTSFLIMIITDGEENSSARWRYKLDAKIKELTKTDRWTFVWRVPVGYKQNLISQFDVPEGNVFEWETTDAGFAQAEAATQAGFSNYYAGVARGVKSTSTFFVNVDAKVMKKAISSGVLHDISDQVNIVACHGEQEIKPFVSTYFKRDYVKGCAFYQLNKTETIQADKEIAVRDLSNGKVYSGYEARDLLGLPHGDSCKVKPGDKAGFEIFVQSNSVNRKLMDKQQVLVWWRA